MGKEISKDFKVIIMREIKFRAWTGNRMMDFEEIKHGGYTPWNSTSLIWMQSTGLFDKHGKEIFEGDVLNYDSVGFEGGIKCMVEYISSGFYCHGSTPVFSICEKEAEIIGDIYSTPELLS